MALSTVARELARRFKRDLEARLPGRVLDVRVFGSIARGEGTEDSDLDILVLVEDLDLNTRRTIFDIAFDIDFATGFVLPLAPLPMTRERYEHLRRRELLIALEIERDGVRV